MLINTTYPRKHRRFNTDHFGAEKSRDWSERVCREIVLQAIRDCIEDQQPHSTGARIFLLSEFGEQWIDGSGFDIGMIRDWVEAGCRVPENIRRRKVKTKEVNAEEEDVLAAYPFE